MPQGGVNEPRPAPRVKAHSQVARATKGGDGVHASRVWLDQASAKKVGLKGVWVGKGGPFARQPCWASGASPPAPGMGGSHTGGGQTPPPPIAGAGV